MLKAANIAGKAINITQTTAGHAMCYKLTTLYGIAHGHAAALCVSALMPYMINHTNDFVDIRGKSYLDKVFCDLSETMNCNTTDALCDKWNDIVSHLNLKALVCKEKDYEILTSSINPTRLKNNPVRLSTDTINSLYHQILSKEQ